MNAAVGENLVEERGLVFEKSLRGGVEILLVGDNNCGKVQLIRSIFRDFPSFMSTYFATRREYRVTLLSVPFHIAIQDVTDVDFLRNADFPDRFVFLFCYDIHNNLSLERLKDFWIPAVLERSLPNMHSLLVGIKREPVVLVRASSQQRVLASNDELNQLCRHFHIPGHYECSIADRDSMLKVFQTAIDRVYPRTPIN